MMKFYGTMICQDCVKAREALNAAGVLFDYVDITTSPAALRDFLRLRDTHKEFDAARRDGRIGIPCFVRDDGTVIVGAQTLLDAARA